MKASKILTIDEREKLHPEQWVKVYGVVSNYNNYIITCQVYQLETVLGGNRKGWWDGYVLEPVDEEDRPISVEEAFNKNRGG